MLVMKLEYNPMCLEYTTQYAVFCKTNQYSQFPPTRGKYNKMTCSRDSIVPLARTFPAYFSNHSPPNHRLRKSSEFSG